MKKTLLLMTGAFLMVFGSLKGSAPLKDYSFVRGANYTGWKGDQQSIERELGYAKRLQLNSTRIWLYYKDYLENPDGYIEKVRNYIRTADKMGITTMPILWSGNMIDTAILKKEFRETGDKYVKRVVEALKDEKGLLMWDIMNEPHCNDYYMKAPSEVKLAREAEITDFVRHYCTFVKKIDPMNAITVGHTFTEFLRFDSDLVDVISFHDYLETRKRVENSYSVAETYGKKYNKPVINSEMACICRANPYDVALEICERHKMGWYVFELMIGGYWGDVHGLVYPDGTIRDPSVIAAIYGFYRNRDSRNSIRPNPNKEGNVYKALEQLEKSLKDETTVFKNKKTSTDDILEAAEYCANFLEASEMVPMIDPPTVKIKAWREQPEKERDAAAIRSFAYDLGQTLKKYCQIY